MTDPREAARTPRRRLREPRFSEMEARSMMSVVLLCRQYADDSVADGDLIETTLAIMNKIREARDKC